jgi:hypothetical protein
MENVVISWVVRMLMIAASVMTSWFVAKDAPIFGVVQLMVTIMLLTLIVAVLAFWPAHWTIKLNRLQKPFA